MWFAARDIAFENPVTEDETVLMLERMGISTPGTRRQGRRRRACVRQALANRVLLDDDIDFELESLIARMVRLLLIEISAFHAFAWAEEVLADTDLVAGDGEAATLVSYIRADETPHVEYLQDGAVGDARPHVRRRVGQALSGHRDHRPRSGTALSTCRSTSGESTAWRRHGGKSPTRWTAVPIATTSSSSSTPSARPSVAPTARGSTAPPDRTRGARSGLRS